MITTIRKPRRPFLTALLSCVCIAVFGLSQTSARADDDGYRIANARLLTPWATKVSHSNPLPDYPRPQLTRSKWQSLNGLWQYSLSGLGSQTAPTQFSGKILVPFPYESSLSGVAKPTPAASRLWCHRTFSVPRAWDGQNVLLHFGAVNWDSVIYVNGRQIGAHRGGYDPFEFDITSALRPGQNTIDVSIWNPLKDAQVRGKQTLHSYEVFYCGATGIWQPVWLEPVPAAHISDLKITPDIDNGVVRITVNVVEPDGLTLKISASDGKKAISSLTGSPGEELALSVQNASFWSPENPHLYDLKVELQRDGKTVDQVGSYFAMRKISLGKDTKGRTCIYLNNKEDFRIGVLDQGYWPDGVYTAPTDEALRFDIEMAKKLGFNLIRKHAKVEPDRWYYWADKIGELVWQDMPQTFGNFTDDDRAQWLTEWKREIITHYNHPSIVMWTPFNEGWGQHDTEAVVNAAKELDQSRLINNASGWVDKGLGDIVDVHVYPGPGSANPEKNRAAVNGEFGAVSYRYPGHLWFDDLAGANAVPGNGWYFVRRYQELIRRAYDLHESTGTCAFIYCQLTDVEHEFNGMLTYDRRFVKPYAKYFAAANLGDFLMLPPNPSPDILPTSQRSPQTWRYVTSNPGADWTKLDFDDLNWKTGQAPFGHGYNVGSEWSDTPGDIWMRQAFVLPADIPEKIVVRAEHDEDMEVYINGVLAASAPGVVVDEYIEIPVSDAARETMKSGKNLIAVHCHQTAGGQKIDVGLAPQSIVQP